MAIYTAVTFSPVQGFIEKSRKLRDLHGASIILSHLSKILIESATKKQRCKIISPGLGTAAKGIPNRILIEGEFTSEQTQETLRTAWKNILKKCKEWIEKNVPETTPDTFYHWDRDWELWGVHTWEIFWGTGNTIASAIDDLESHKLSRNWTGINWIGESSSITGTDAIAWNGLGKGTRNPKYQNWSQEKEQIEKFYRRLSLVLDGLNPESKEEPEGKFVAPNERLSIPELVKRLVTKDDIAKSLDMECLDQSFSDILRKPQDNPKTGEGRWTGWFMGDGDKVGDHLQKLVKKTDGKEQIKQFSQEMVKWGEKFRKEFRSDLGRIIYAGGDDFLGVIYNNNKDSNQLKKAAFEWLLKLKDEWDNPKKKPISLSVGFVWAGHSVPQRDILQHCREAEQRSKALGRDRLTIRIVFNSGQYIQWTCPWDKLDLLQDYRDRDGGTNWSHIYNDLAQLKARHAINPYPYPQKSNTDGHLVNKSSDFKLALALLNIYFQQQGDYIRQNSKHLINEYNTPSPSDILSWIDEFIQVGWQLCS